MSDASHSVDELERELRLLQQKVANLQSLESWRQETEKALEDYQRQIQDKVNRLQLLKTFYEATTVTHDLQTIYQLLYDIFPKHFHHLGIDRVSLLMYDQKSGSLVSDQLIGASHRGEVLVSGHQELGYSISGKCFLSGQPIIVEDCSQTDLIPEQWVRQLHLKSTVALPIKFEGKVIGVLRIDSTVKPQHFTESDIDFLSMVAEQLGIVIENASLLLERQRAEEALARSRASFRSIVQKSRDGIIILNEKGIVKFCNPSAERMLSWEADSALDKPFEIPIGDAERSEIKIIRYNGEQGIGELRVIESDWDGEQASLVTLYDVTERSRARQQIENYANDLARKNSEMEADLHLAHEFQEAILPVYFQRYPIEQEKPEALRFYHRYISSGAVGGDFFDVRPISETSIGVLICDVMGHGVRAALVTAIIDGMIEKMGNLAKEPALLLSEMNRKLVDVLKRTQKQIFVTAFYMILDYEKGQVEYANGGHPLPFLRSGSDGRLTRLGNENNAIFPAIGLLPEVQYSMTRREISKGDMILLFTDGVFEVFGPNGDEFGEERLEKALLENREMATSSLLDKILEEIRAFSSSEEARDDICLVGVDIV